MLLEADQVGNYVGSSYGWASTRDWARFGLLYLQNGVWEGERLLPAGWVSYTTTPTPKAPRGEYGALFWLNAGSTSNPANRRWPSIPKDAYLNELLLIVFPHKELENKMGKISDFL